jgi:cytochrome c oxidase subunit 4
MDIPFSRPLFIIGEFMDHSHPDEIKKHVRKYIFVFVALLILTMVTVAVSYLQLSVTGTVALALVIATIKGSLVAAYFMHLISEKKLIYVTLIFTAIFFIGLMALPLFTFADPITNTHVH